MVRESMSRYEGKILEGPKGAVLAAVLAAVVVGLAVAQQLLLPEQVVMHVGLSGEANGWAPKWFPLLASAGLGLAGAAWFAASRAKAGLLVAVTGMAVGVLALVMTGAFS